MSLHDLTVAAEQEFATYRDANIDEWRAAIDPVLKAAGECVIGNDKVDDIEVSAKEIRIRASYSVRCCAQTNDMRLPAFIVKSENPVQAATRYRIDKELSVAKSRLAAAQRSVIEHSEKVTSLEAELATLA